MFGGRLSRQPPQQSSHPLPPNAAFIEKQYNAELAAKNSFEQRGFTVITTSATLATLTFGIAKLVSPQVHLDSLGGYAVAFSLVFFVGAALFGLIVNMPADYHEITNVGLDDMVRPEDWAEDPNASQWRLSQALVETIKVARGLNRRKAWALRLGLFSETLALVGLLVAVIALLR